MPTERFQFEGAGGDKLAAALDLPELRRQAKSEALPALVQWISDLVAQDLRSVIRRGDQDIQLLPPRD